MDRQNVDALLAEYRENQARYNHLYIDAMDMVRKINAEARKAIANDAVHAQQYKDSPPSGQISKPVENLALRYADGYMPGTIKAWMAESEEMQRELRDLETDIVYVDTWLGGLKEHERIVVTASRIDGLKWPEIAQKSKELFGEYKSDSTLRHWCKVAMGKIYNVAR